MTPADIGYWRCQWCGRWNPPITATARTEIWIDERHVEIGPDYVSCYCGQKRSVNRGPL